MELPGYDPRGAKGIGLVYAVSSRGACHKFAYTLRDEMWTGKVDRFTESGKASLVKDLSDVNAFLHSAVICTFPIDQGVFGLEDLREALGFVTGEEFSVDDLRRIGERMINVERLFNLREGFSREDDTLPERFLKESLEDLPSAGETVDLEKMLENYYSLRGWDRRGRPLREKLEELGISVPD